MNKKILKTLMYLIFALYTFFSFGIMYLVNMLNVLNIAYFAIFAVIIFAAWLIIIIKLFNKKTHSYIKIIMTIICLILSVSYFVCGMYINNSIHFVSNMTNIEYETQKYSVRVLNDSNYNSINDLENKTLGFIDNNTKYVTKELSKKINYKSNKYSNLGSIFIDLKDSNIDSVVLEESYLELLRENNSTLVDDTKEIYYFEVKVKKGETKTPVNTSSDPFILYISGSDSRKSVSDTARSDVNIVSVINPKEHKILLVSIPRDYYVQLHDTTGTKDKLTHAGIYGINKSKNTIEDLLDIKINYYTKVSFTTVINVVDVIDGIDIYSDKNFKAWTNKSCVFNEGMQHVDGKCALAFARERYSYTSGDRHRGENQQAVITAIFDKFTSNPKYLLKYNDILKSIDGSFETDLSYDEITNLFKSQLNYLSKWKIESISLDGTGASLPTYSMGSQKLYVMIPDESTIEKAKEKIKEYLNK